jgi:hypothetical protein
MKRHIRQLERELVLANPRVAKLLVSPTYSKLKKEWFTEIFLSYIVNAVDNEIQGNEDTHDVASITIDGASEEEAEEDCGETDTGTDDSDSESSESEC